MSVDPHSTDEAMYGSEDVDGEMDYGEADYGNDAGEGEEIDYGDYSEFATDEYTDTYDEPFETAAHERAKEEESNFRCLTPEQIVKEQSEKIQKVADLFDIPAPTSKQLLTYMKWNEDALIERYYGGEEEKLYSESGVENPKKKKKLRELDLNDTVECTICIEPITVKDMTRLGCGHIFCNSCWFQYLSVKINDAIVTGIMCAARGCKTQLDEVTISKLIAGNEALIKKYNKLAADAYVTMNKNVRWCPGRGCSNAVRVELLKDKEVKCTCGTTFCFGCGEFPHAPADCQMIKEWKHKQSRDGDDAKWMASYTKECPNCGKTIHKDGGCQYMTCTSCSHKFCWMCLGSFDHKDHACNKFKEEKGADPNSERARLNKYIFFYTRYQNHQQSIDLEDKLMGKAEKQMHELSAKGMSWIDVQFIKQATKTLMEARQMLKYTYVYGFYLPKNVNRSLFELLQTDLEDKVERLSGLLEAAGEKDRLAVINASKYVESRQKKLLEELAEGGITGKGGAHEERVYTSQVEVYEGWVYKTGS